MITFRFSLFVGVVGLLFAAPTVGQPRQLWLDTEGCDNIDPQVVRDCVDKRLAGKELLLEQLYGQALASVTKNHRQWSRDDSRSDPSYFVRAQKEWKRFVDDNCTAIGAIGGGSSSSVAERIEACYERELDGRIELLRAIADGSFTAP